MLRKLSRNRSQFKLEKVKNNFINTDKYKNDDWVVYFSGDKWSPLGFSSWITLFTLRPFLKDIEYFINQNIMVWDGKTTTCYIRESERKTFGEKIVEKVVQDPKYVDYICERFQSGTDSILSIYHKKSENFTYKDYEEYNATFLDKYYRYHIQVKNVVDFLPKNLLEKYLPKLEAARVHAEPVFSQEVGFMKKIAEYVAKESEYKEKHILQTFAGELTDYWRDGKKLPDEAVLEERYKGCVVFFEKGSIQDVLVGKEIPQLSSIFLKENDSDDIKGQTAFEGKVQGVVRVIFDPSNVKEFNDGDILVAPWTRPEYLSIMKKAAAFVTDGGGVLSHAAIIAREFKTPCVIGTKIATQALKDGDLVEVDATEGIVKKIK